MKYLKNQMKILIFQKKHIILVK